MGSDDSKDQDSAWDDIATAISAEPLPVVEGLRQRPCLVLIAGQRIGDMVAVTHGLTVGRGVDADFQISDDGVSRIHLRLELRSDGRVDLVDQKSRNGTFINGAKIERATLHDGDKIYLGTSAILRFSYADHLEETFQQRMYEAALRDPLTRLFNRRHVLAQLESEFGFVRRHGTPLTVVLLDLDHFKKVNDEFGHLVGDQVLIGFGSLLRKKLRGVDIAGRYGGEEFVVVARGIRADDGVLLAERMLAETRAARLVPDKPELKITFSAGVASAPDSRVDTVAALLQAADEALYQAKDRGRDRVEIY
jgi:two-component system cell cycle response regulator